MINEILEHVQPCNLEDLDFVDFDNPIEINDDTTLLDLCDFIMENE